ncbi:MAG: transglycosylase SLT domain-containing protein [Saccharospirillaceae bacterium]|nr:transglycosylase SLT domain-containing protein [Saccharospirillaceae bacterium]
MKDVKYSRAKAFSSLFAFLFLMQVANIVNAATYPPEPPAYKRLSAKYGLPEKLLYAIALNESQVKTNKRHATPWPWVIRWNKEDKGRWYRTKDEAVAFAEKLLLQGFNNFDVGIAQVNYKWHGHEFNSISQMMSPRNNLDYAASLIKGFYDGGDDWWVSAGRYHAPYNKPLAKGYSNRVYKIYKDL